MPKYRKNYLSEVIARVDFSLPIESINNEIDGRLIDSIKIDFPLMECHPTVSKTVEVDKTDKVSVISTNGKRWMFFDRRRESKVIIEKNYILISFTKYSGYDELSEKFIRAFTEMCNTYSDIRVSRIGLRYINNIDCQGVMPTEWNGYINENLLGLLRFVESRNELTRAFSIIELLHNDIRINFNLGMNNPDYPAAIKKRHFVLDYDAFIEGEVEASQLNRYLSNFHQVIIDLFEKSIDYTLRGEMEIIEQ